MIEHRRFGVRDAIDEPVKTQHGLAFSDEVRRANRSPRGLVAQPLHLLAEPLVPDRSVDGDREDLNLDGLADEIVRAHADGLHGSLQRPERRQHDDWHVGPALDDTRAQFDPAGPPQVEVRHDRVKAFELERAQRLSR